MHQITFKEVLHNMIVLAPDDRGNLIDEERWTPYIEHHNFTLIEEFIRRKQLEGCSDATLRQYHDYMVRISIDVGKKLEDLNTNDIRSFLSNYQETRQCKNHTMDNMRRAYSSFFNFIEEEYSILNPVKKIHKIKSEKTLQMPFTDEEIIMIEDACKNIRELTIINFLNSSGIRVSELCGLNRNSLSLNTREGKVFGKGSKERKFYIDARTKVHLEKYLKKRTDSNPALFVTANAPFNRLTKTGCEYMVAQIGTRAGVEKCHPHRFRRTLATRLIDRGVPIEQVQQILGHTKLDTTLIYAQVNQTNVKLNHSKFC